MYCSHCGGPLDRLAARCPSCGRDVPAGARDAPRPEAPAERPARWRPADEPKAEPPSGLRGRLLRLLGADPPARPTATRDVAVAPEPPPEAAPEAWPEEVESELSPDLIKTERLEEEPPPAQRTVAGFGIDVGRLKVPTTRHILQVFDASGVWRDWGMVSAQGLVVGRGRASADVPALQTLAARHFRLAFDGDGDGEGDGLGVEDLGSLNGVYRRIAAATPLADGARFRVGHFVLEFRAATPGEPAATLRAGDFEEFCAAELVALAYLDAIRPDGEVGLRVPILRPEGLILGRDPKEASLALPDMVVSTRHAQVRRDPRAGGFVLEDLGSRNGTYLRVGGRGAVADGDVLLAGQVLFRIATHAPEEG